MRGSFFKETVNPLLTSMLKPKDNLSRDTNETYFPTYTVINYIASPLFSFNVF